MMLKSVTKRTPVFNFTLIIDRKCNNYFITSVILKGYFADPITIKERDKFYIYAAIDP